MNSREYFLDLAVKFTVGALVILSFLYLVTKVGASSGRAYKVLADAEGNKVLIQPYVAPIYEVELEQGPNGIKKGDQPICTMKAEKRTTKAPNGSIWTHPAIVFQCDSGRKFVMTSISVD